MADVFELSPFDEPAFHWQALRSPFQRLNTRHPVDRNSLPALFRDGRCRLVDFADIGALLVEIGIGFTCQPVTDQMRLKVRSF